MKTVFVSLFLSLFSCTNSIDHKSKKADNGRIVTPQQKNRDFTKDSVIRIDFPTGGKTVTIIGKLNGINTPVTVLIPVNHGNQLTVLVAPEDSIANIRINQVFMPSGKVDGPFGKTLQVKTPVKGEYKLVIGENLMQGDEWKGRFTLTVSVK